MGSYKKKLFIVLLLTLLIGFFVCGSANAVESTVTLDNIESMRMQQDFYAKIFFYYVEKSSNETLKLEIKEKFKNKFVYFNTYRTNTANYPNFITANFYDKSNNFGYLSLQSGKTYDSEDSINDDGNYLVPDSGYIVSCERYSVSTYDSAFSHIANYNVQINSLILGYTPSEVDKFLNDIPTSSSSFAVILQAITSNTEQEEETTNEMKKLNDFMSSEDVDQDAYDMPTTNPTQDPTTDGINNIFNKFYSRITNWDSSSINVYIPFANKSFTIPANASEQLLNNFSNMGLGSTLKSLISAVWFYVLARYIIKDVQKYVDGLKTGEILTKSDTNIKTEML